MDTEQLEIYLISQSEKQNVDFKYPICWDVSKFAKHILAMSNIQNGGCIIIGVEQKESIFNRIGVTKEIKDSYILDMMRDDMAGLSDPPTNFDVAAVKDKNNLEYIVINVHQFIDVPIICISDKYNLKAGTIYYRNAEKRIESSPISNSCNLRNLLTLASSLLHRELGNLGYVIKNTDKQKFDEELGDL